MSRVHKKEILECTVELGDLVGLFAAVQAVFGTLVNIDGAIVATIYVFIFTVTSHMTGSIDKCELIKVCYVGCCIALTVHGLPKYKRGRIKGADCVPLTRIGFEEHVSAEL